MSFVLQAQERGNLTRHELRLLRKNGSIPAVIYGKKINSTPILVGRVDFLKGIKEVGKNAMLSIDVAGKKHQVILRSYEEDSLSREILHIDFLAVDSSSKITTNVRLVLTGEAFGVKDGGVLQQSLHELSITAQASDIPESIAIDITELKVADTLYVEQIKNQFDFEINHEDGEVVASILPPRQEEEISTGEEQEPGIPENLEGREK